MNLNESFQSILNNSRIVNVEMKTLLNQCNSAKNFYTKLIYNYRLHGLTLSFQANNILLVARKILRNALLNEDIETSIALSKLFHHFGQKMEQITPRENLEIHFYFIQIALNFWIEFETHYLFVLMKRFERLTIDPINNSTLINTITNQWKNNTLEKLFQYTFARIEVCFSFCLEQFLQFYH